MDGQLDLQITPMYKILDNEYLELRIQFAGGVPFAHSTFKQWSPKLYRAYRNTWEQICKDLDGAGHPCVFVMIPDNDPKLLKFEKMFGFKEVERQNGNILLMYEVNYGN